MKMTNMLEKMGIKLGMVDSAKWKYVVTPLGLGFKNSTGTVRCFNKETCEVTELPDELVLFEDAPAFYMPITEVAVGDYIEHNNVPVVVTKVNKKTFAGVSLATGINCSIPATKTIMGEQRTKIVGILDLAGGTADPANPMASMQGMLPMLMLMKDDNDKDMSQMLMMLALSGGGGIFGGTDGTNPMTGMLPIMMLMKDGKDNDMSQMLMLMAMSTGGGIFGGSTEGANIMAGMLPMMMLMNSK